MVRTCESADYDGYMSLETSLKSKSFKNTNNSYLEMGHGSRILIGYLKGIGADELDECSYRQETVIAALLDQEGHVEIPHAKPFRHLDLSERTWKRKHSS